MASLEPPEDLPPEPPRPLHEIITEMRDIALSDNPERVRQKCRPWMFRPHDWTLWRTMSTTRTDDPVEQQRRCLGCGLTEIRAIRSRWRPMPPCMHFWDLKKEIRVYASTAAQAAGNLPIRRDWVMVCTECGIQQGVKGV